MAASLLNRFYLVMQRLNYTVATLFNRRFPQDEFCLAAIDLNISQPPPKQFTIKDLMQNGYLWAVPRNRRTVEKRWKRKFGNPYYHLKILLPKNTLRVCNVCGDDHEIGVLCPTCYKKIIQETKDMQDAIQNELKLKPIEKEVVVLYQGEKDKHPPEYWEGKRIVEIDKPRPSWFSQNLLQQTTQQPATTTDVKPSDLG